MLLPPHLLRSWRHRPREGPPERTTPAPGGMGDAGIRSFGGDAASGRRRPEQLSWTHPACPRSSRCVASQACENAPSCAFFPLRRSPRRRRRLLLNRRGRSGAGGNAGRRWCARRVAAAAVAAVAVPRSSAWRFWWRRRTDSHGGVRCAAGTRPSVDDRLHRRRRRRGRHDDPRRVHGDADRGREPRRERPGDQGAASAGAGGGRQQHLQVHLRLGDVRAAQHHHCDRVGASGAAVGGGRRHGSQQEVSSWLFGQPLLRGSLLQCAVAVGPASPSMQSAPETTHQRRRRSWKTPSPLLCTLSWRQKGAAGSCKQPRQSARRRRRERWRL